MNARHRSLQASIAAHAMHAQHDRRETTANARKAFLERFERQVDPHMKLSPVERRERAESAKKAYFRQLALKSAQARAQRSGQ